MLTGKSKLHEASLKSIFSINEDHLRNIEVVSFDVFDTLLCRPVIKPSDLFKLIEFNENASGYFKARVQAESHARKIANNEEITFDSIYECINPSFKRFKKIELDYEFRFLKPITEIQDIYNFILSNGKKIVVISDMYLSGNIIRELLSLNGYSRIDKVYCSSDFGVTKHTGNLFNIVLNDLKLTSPSKLLHVGDNQKSDFDRPRDLGISTARFSCRAERVDSFNPQLSSFLSGNDKKNLDGSLLSGLLCNAAFNSKYNSLSYWEKLGFNYTGPIAAGFCKFIEQKADANNIDLVIFVARDGFILEKFFNKFSDKKSLYIYAPRYTNLICRLDYDTGDFEQTSELITYYKNADIKIKELLGDRNLMSAGDNAAFIQANIEAFQAAADRELANYRNYLKHLIPEDVNHIAVVDTITKNFSAQKLIEKALNKKVLGIYWTLNDDAIYDAPQYNVETYVNYYQSISSINGSRTLNWPFVEFLLSSPEPSIKTISSDGKPFYQKVDLYEEKRSNFFSDTVEGALGFLDYLSDTLKDSQFYIAGPTLVNWVNCFVLHPSKCDINEMMQLSVSQTFNNSKYFGLFIEDATFKDFICSPKAFIKRVSNSRWKTKEQKIILALFYPVKIRLKKRILNISLLPKFDFNIFSMKLNLGSVFTVKVNIGKVE